MALKGTTHRGCRLALRPTPTTRVGGIGLRDRMSRVFETPIVLDDGRTLLTIGDAHNYVTSLPKTEQKKPHYAATAMLP
jgi:hypothetical protein